MGILIYTGSQFLVMYEAKMEGRRKLGKGTSSTKSDVSICALFATERLEFGVILKVISSI